MKTYEEVMGAHDVEIPAHLVAEAEVPVLSGLQVQGDVAIIPRKVAADLGSRVPADGLPVVRGEAGGNTHLLVGDAWWRPANDLLTLGYVNVPEGGDAYLLHPEHGAMGLAPGSYEIRRQREQADEIRRVAD